MSWTIIIWVFVVLGLFSILIVIASTALNRMEEERGRQFVNAGTESLRRYIEQYKEIHQGKPYTPHQVRGWYHPWADKRSHHHE